jgi:hypothetical protein
MRPTSKKLQGVEGGFVVDGCGFHIVGWNLFQAEVCGCGETQGYRELEVWKNFQVFNPSLMLKGEFWR